MRRSLESDVASTRVRHRPTVHAGSAFWGAAAWAGVLLALAGLGSLFFSIIPGILLLPVGVAIVTVAWGRRSRTAGEPGPDERKGQQPTLH
jgi:hypothetical protein